MHLVLTPSQKPTDLLATGEEFAKVLACPTGIPVRVTVASDYAAVIRGAPQPDGRPGVRASRRRRPGEPATVYFPGLASGINTTDGAPLLDGMDPGQMTKRPG